MAKEKPVVSSGSKNTMIRVRCPKNDNAEFWANVGPKKGPVCTKCGGTGHEKAK